jgi:hypothetical protein
VDKEGFGKISVPLEHLYAEPTTGSSAISGEASNIKLILLIVHLLAAWFWQPETLSSRLTVARRNLNS